jgi:hypothetical protein
MCLPVCNYNSVGLCVIVFEPLYVSACVQLYLCLYACNSICFCVCISESLQLYLYVCNSISV